MKAPSRVVKKLFYVICGSFIVSIILLVLWLTMTKGGEYSTSQPDLQRSGPERSYPLLVSYNTAGNQTNSTHLIGTDSGGPTGTDSGGPTGTNSGGPTGTDSGGPTGTDSSVTERDSMSTYTESGGSTGTVSTGTDPVLFVSYSIWYPPRAIHHYGIHDWSVSSESPLVWKDQFCKEFIGKTFDKSSTVCGEDRVVCHGTHLNKRIGKCVIDQLAVKPQLLKDRFADRTLSNSKSAWLIPSSSSSDDRVCLNPRLSDITQFMETGDPFHKLVQSLSSQRPLGDCSIMVKGVSFFYMGVGDHIYFKMLSWYNLHRTLIQYSAEHNNISNFIIVRLPETKSPFKFVEFEQSLFPQSFGIDEFPKGIVCFEKVVLVPWTYAATPFRCKMDGIQLKRKCMGCHGNELETDLRSFRRRVLSSCSLDDEKPMNKQRRTFLIIQRKQYLRRLGDSHGKFQRIWTNSKELVDRLKSVYPNDNIVGIYGEDLSICDQVRHAHSADVLIGMHGAGLVHIWWLRDGTISFELVPPSQRGNGAFSTLSTLLGKKHHQFSIVKERGAVVTVDIDRLIKEISSKL